MSNGPERETRPDLPLFLPSSSKTFGSSPQLSTPEPTRIYLYQVLLSRGIDLLCTRQLRLRAEAAGAAVLQMLYEAYIRNGCPINSLANEKWCPVQNMP
jgi:hypothetical protein